MKKAELLKLWQKTAKAHELSYSIAELEYLFQSLSTIAAQELHEGGEIAFPHLGKLATIQAKAREARNPRTGEKIHIPARAKVKFKPAKAFTELLN